MKFSFYLFLICVINIPHLLFAQNPDTSGIIQVTVEDDGLPAPVRVKITDSDGMPAPVPKEVISIMYGRDDRPERYSYQPDSSFYVMVVHLSINED